MSADSLEDDYFIEKEFMDESRKKILEQENIKVS